MCLSLTGLSLYALYHLILPVTPSDKGFRDPYLKTEERKYTEVRKSYLRSHRQDSNLKSVSFIQPQTK